LLDRDGEHHGRARQRWRVRDQSTIGAGVTNQRGIRAMVVRGRVGMGEKQYGCKMRVMPMMMRVMLSVDLPATQHLRYRRCDDAQQNREHPEESPDLLTVAAEHGKPTRRRPN
jgi:hypothetical protein